MQLRKKIRVFILKTKRRKNEKQKFIARFTKEKKIKKTKNEDKNLNKKRNSMMKHLSTPISFPESSPSVVGREIFKQMNLFLEYSNSQFRFSDKSAEIQM